MNWKLPPYETFERAAKFAAGLTWATWEVMVREQPDPARLVFIATVLGVSEAVKAVSKAKEEDE